jgi:hypothetical protein
MNPRLLLGIVSIILAFVSSATTQTQPQAAAGVGNITRAGRAYVSGENPGIRLLDKQDGATLTQVSFWRVHWSPVGTGHVCYVTVGEDKSPGELRIGLYDNQKLFDYLTKEMLGTFNKAFIDRPFVPVGGATFGFVGDATHERREFCRSDRYSVELIWRDLQTPYLIDILAGSRPPNPFGLTYLRIPAANAEVIINGKPAPGKAFLGPAGPSAFLAFGETWLK